MNYQEITSKDKALQAAARDSFHEQRTLEHLKSLPNVLKAIGNISPETRGKIKCAPVNAACNVTIDYFKGLGGLADRAARASKEEERSILSELSLLKNKTIDAIRSEFGTLRKKHATKTPKVLYSEQDFTPDFEYLRLPVVLSGNEIQALFERNVTNRLFRRALEEYIAIHDIKSDDGITNFKINDPHEKQLATINDTEAALVDWVEQDNPLGFSAHMEGGTIAQASGVLEAV